MLRSSRSQLVRLFNRNLKQKNGRQSPSITDTLTYTLLAILGGIWLLFAANRPVYAGMQLSAFDVLVLTDGVILEWQTVSEKDLIGFEIWYKQEEESQSSYEFLGKRIAQGSLQRAVTYRMDVTNALKADNVYCFQLRELPINGERGEIHNRCGYGLGISAKPTPTPTPIFTPTTILTATTVLTPSTSLTLPMPITGTVEPYPTYLGPTTTLPTDTLPVQPNEGGEASVVLPTPFNQSPLPTPSPDAANWALTPPPPAFQDQSLLPTPTLPITMTEAATMTSGPVAPAAMSGAPELLSQTAGLTTTSFPTDGTNFTSPLPMPTAPAAAVADPPYIVLTATPTVPATIPAPTFTPYPTGVSQAEINLLGLRAPDTQSLMIMLLCGVFSGASGLGILGLVSTLLYMRSRASARDNRTTQRQL